MLVYTAPYYLYVIAVKLKQKHFFQINRLIAVITIYGYDNISTRKKKFSNFHDEELGIFKVSI